VLVNDKRVLLTRHRNGYQLLLRNVVVFNPLLSSEEAFIQRFRQQYLIFCATASDGLHILAALFFGLSVHSVLLRNPIIVP